MDWDFDDKLARFDGNEWIVYNTSNSGLPSAKIHSIAIDNSDNIWIGTENGLAVYNNNGINLVIKESNKDRKSNPKIFN